MEREILSSLTSLMTSKWVREAVLSQDAGWETVNLPE